MNIDHLKIDSLPFKFFDSYINELFFFVQISDRPLFVLHDKVVSLLISCLLVILKM